MPYPLTLSTILQRNQMLFGKKEVVTRDFGGIHRYTYAEYGVRVGEAGQRARAPRGEAGRTGGHLRVEQPPAPRGVLRRAVHGLRPPHDQHPALRRPARLHRQPRGGRRAARGRGPRSLRGGRGGQDPVRAGLRDHERQEDGAGDQAPSRLLVRSAPRRGEGGVRLADGHRRELHGGPVLHHGDDGEPQGRAVHPPGDLPARPGDLHGGPGGHRREGHGDARGADVPRERLGHCRSRRPGWARSRSSRAPARTRRRWSS